MLSYQHAYHAGSPADVHKHIALVLLVRRLQRKGSPLCYIDGHAGRGIYDLDSAEARKTAEAERGIRRLVQDPGAPEAVRDYLSLAAGANPPDSRNLDPGSAALAQAMLRDQGRAILLELHPQEVEGAPWRLDEELAEALGHVVAALSPDRAGRLEHRWLPSDSRARGSA